MTGATTRQSSQPLLEPLAATLAASERLREFLGDHPGTRARVSEPLLPLFIAGAWLASTPRAGLVVVLADDEDARDAAEGVGWYLGADQVGLLASRGVRQDTGLTPPAHLVGERARALDVLAGGGVACASALGFGEGLPPAGARAETVRLDVGDTDGVEELAVRLALAGYERVERVEARGEFAVRGGLIDIFPTTGREPVRIEFFGDEIETLRAFSPFTQRTLGTLERVEIYPAAERRAVTHDPELAETEPGEHELVEPLAACDLVWELDEVQRVAQEELGRELRLGGPSELSALPGGQSHTFEGNRPAITARGLSEAERDLRGLVQAGNRVVVSFQHRGEALRRQAMLRRIEAPLIEEGEPFPLEAGVSFVISPARRGLVSRELGLALVPETQVFRKRGPRTQARVGRALQAFTDLRTGDYVVHEDHGVGQLLGFETKTVAEITRDYLFLGFKGDDRLYVPHEQIGKVSRYVGGDGAGPALSKLGGKAWQNIKSRARAGARELAGELIELYARRQTSPGLAFSIDGELLDTLEGSFPFEETGDQRLAIEAVKEDMETARPMDRLVCGDVGFGKTEVAVRAALIAAADGKQTLLLAPTTVLAQQHWNTFRERYVDIPITTDMVSRFRRSGQVKEILGRFADGKIDVLIGTHRVLSRDVIPKQLGLLIIDEEQRFGVAQKELLRQLRREVDVLAMSATPIPRTLHMSLAGLRDISVIETPPQGRRPIRTHVGEHDDELVQQALTREAARGGQSFYLHNRVETIDELAEKLQQLCPDLRFLVGHGQLSERQLEDVMLRFVSGDADVLVATTIIESGLDIPQANTLIVERADTLGLAQLYQLRGRVGRSDVVAHAYLLYPEAAELSGEAKARLATLADHTELGAGFAIAMRDLEIRGAGNLLGSEQSGHVAAIGFELYVELLNEAVAELAGTTRQAPRPVRVDAQVDAYVPADFIDAEALKIDLHRRLALSETEEELRELEASTEDRFGALPEPVRNLFAIQETKLNLAKRGGEYLVYRGGKLTVGPLVLGSEELKQLRKVADTAVYRSAQREVNVRVETLDKALEHADAILSLVA